MKTIKSFLLVLMVFFNLASLSYALTYTFTDKGTNTTWGTMDISVLNANTLQIQYNAASGIPFSEATGIGFEFIPKTVLPTGITNPLNNLIIGDRDDLVWKKSTNLNSLPDPENSQTITKHDFYYAATAGNANNFNPPGIKPGEFDVFYLSFSGLPSFLVDFNLEDFVQHAGVRLQSLPDCINGGSLFLVNDPGTPPVPEPGTIVLLGAGLLGLGLYGRRRMKAK